MSTNLQSKSDKSAAYFPLRAIPARPIDRGETDMMEIFLIQLLAAGLGALSTAWADWSYNRARIGRRLHALLGCHFYRDDLPAGRVLDLDGIPWFGAARPIGRRHTCRCDLSLGVSKPAKVPPNPQIWAGPSRGPWSGAVPPGIQARWVDDPISDQRLPFAATCSALERVSFSGWTIVLFTAARAAPRLGNSASTPSRRST